jgi:hypothetical protein
MRVLVRAYNKDGYHKDLASFEEGQVHMKHGNMSEPQMIAVGVNLCPSDFPEAVRFDIVIQNPVLPIR